MIAKNPAIQQPGFVAHWLAYQYAHTQLIAVRRLSDNHRHAISLRRLLCRLAEKPSIVGRGWYCSELKHRPLPEYHAQLAAKFDTFAPPESQFVNAALVRQDCANLVDAVSGVTNIVNHFIAHHSLLPQAYRGSHGNTAPADAGVLTEISSSEFDAAVDKIGDIYRKYYGLVHPGECLPGDLTPVINHSWDRVFEIPWNPSVIETGPPSVRA